MDEYDLKVVTVSEIDSAWTVGGAYAVGEILDEVVDRNISRLNLGVEPVGVSVCSFLMMGKCEKNLPLGKCLLLHRDPLRLQRHHRGMH